MSVILNESSVVISATRPVALSQLISITPGADPAYLVLNAFDRNEYAAAATGGVGSLVGNGYAVSLNALQGDAREAGIVFTYVAASDRYFNSTYGYLDQLVYEPSSSVGDITDLSIFGANSSSGLRYMAANALSLAANDASGFLGTVTVATAPAFTGPVPSQATQDAVARIAESFVGQSWNMNGCWTLASTIAAEAGASLPVQSTADIAGAANGEWFVAYDGPAGSTGDWQSMVRTGDMVGFLTPSSGHITTVVSGSGSGAMVVDNITYVDGNGNVVNPANDGSASDIVVSGPHAASQEFAGVSADSVVIYRLDAPIVTAAGASAAIAGGTSVGLDVLCAAADPATASLGRSVTEYQVYAINPADRISADGAAPVAASLARPVTIAALSDSALVRGAEGGGDTVYVRAYNGAYWGDWSAIGVTGAAAPVAGGVAALPSANTTQTVVITPVAPAAGPNAAPAATAPAAADTIAVYRFFDSADGTHFFTASGSERNGLIASRPDMTYEGVGMNAYASAAGSQAAAPVYRFFDVANGTHFFTASASEDATLAATRPDLTNEGVAFYEDATQQAGDVAVYRLFDTIHGTHLYTESAAELASIVATRSDLSVEGIAFYAPA